jgi:chaperonin GroES
VDSIVPLPLTPEDDPREPRLEDALARVEEELLGENEPSAQEKLQRLANSSGNIAPALSPADLTTIGQRVVDDYEQDDKDREDWKKTATEALEASAQERKTGKKTFPWPSASNINYPILATAMLQFNARAYPAVVKGDEAVLCKVIGRDNGRPVMGPQGPVMGINGQPVPPGVQVPPEMQQALQPIWQVPPGAKTRRAQRVSEYMNTTIFYRMKDWESDTDSLLMQLPVVGCVARKVFYCPIEGEQKSVMVSMLRIVVPQGARSFATTPRITEEICDVFPSTIRDDMRSERYMDVDLWPKPEGDRKLLPDADDKPRLLLEQHCLIDMDEDGCPEPYIVTVDYETRKVLRIEANFAPEDVKLSDDGRVMSIRRGKFFIKYPFFPHPDGRFYDLGLGHLLKDLSAVIDTSINQLMDAGTAQIAGGGFIASGVRLQSRGQGSVIRMAPGEYKTVDVPGDQLRNAIVERTLPNASPITFQILDMILGAAKEISGIKDVITGDASNQGQVGTTLALIEQGLQVFNAIYKRVFRALKEEFSLLFENIGKYGGEDAARDYMNTLDDPEADFAKDFASQDIDIRPVSDPLNVTRIQKMARAQFLQSTMEQLAAVGGDPREALRRVYEAADIEDIDKLLPPPPPPDPMQAEMQKAAFDTKMQSEQGKAMKDITTAGLNRAKTEREQFELEKDAVGTGMQLGAQAA